MAKCTETNKNKLKELVSRMSENQAAALLKKLEGDGLKTS